MKFILRKLFSQFVFLSIIGLLASNAHAQLWFFCSDGPDATDTYTRNVTGPGPYGIAPGYELWTQPGDVVIYSMKPVSATNASWQVYKRDGDGNVYPVVTGGTVSNTLTYTAVGTGPVPSAYVDSINGTAILSQRCIPAKDVASISGIPTLSQWGLIGTGLLLTLATAFHFRPRRRRLQ